MVKRVLKQNIFMTSHMNAILYANIGINYISQHQMKPMLLFNAYITNLL